MIKPAYLNIYVSCSWSIICGNSKRMPKKYEKYLMALINSTQLDVKNLVVSLYFLYKYSLNDVVCMDVSDGSNLPTYLILTSLVLSNKAHRAQRKNISEPSQEGQSIEMEMEMETIEMSTAGGSSSQSFPQQHHSLQGQQQEDFTREAYSLSEWNKYCNDVSKTKLSISTELLENLETHFRSCLNNDLSIGWEERFWESLSRYTNIHWMDILRQEILRQGVSKTEGNT